MNPRLVFMNGPEVGRHVELDGEPIRIGREPDCQIAIDSELVSRRHALVKKISDRLALKDLGSTNGTFVNDNRVEQHELSDGDRIRVGRTVLKFIAAGNIEAHYHQQVYSLMTRDTLTGAYNKRAFEDALRVALERAPEACSLVLFDVDRFKQINDVYGHLAGDQVLREFGALVRNSIVGGEFFARVGGEEFVVLYPGVSLADARERAEDVRREIADAEVRFEGKSVPITVSAGVAELQPDDDADSFYGRADEQLYEAKRQGRNQVQ